MLSPTLNTDLSSSVGLIVYPRHCLPSPYSYRRMLMIATRMRINGERKIVLVFDDGMTAIHHGLNMWTLQNSEGIMLGIST